MFSRIARKIVPSEPVPTLLKSLTGASVAPYMRCYSLVRAIWHCVLGQQYFVSNNGSMGLCLEIYQDGDIIAILLGCAVPVLLRPHEDYYELIRDVYLYGYMYGKGIDELDERKFTLEEFEIR